MRSGKFVYSGRLFGIALAAFLIGGESRAAENEAAASDTDKIVVFDLGGGVKLELARIPAGDFEMGDERGDAEEKPVHRVTIGKPFYLGKFEVTQEQWEAVMGGNPSHFKAKRNPVDRVSWEDCQKFIEKLNEKFARQGATFFLPTEAQWEYACRAGTSARNDAESELTKRGWFADNAEGKTHPVGEKEPNVWGLYDMRGNVWEWCADWYDGDYYRYSPANDPAGPTAVSARVLRGGSWGDPAFYCRASYRHCLPPWFRVYSYGLRVACAK
jgi:formylglycine-generating enzyme required for sulfatase activity